PGSAPERARLSEEPVGARASRHAAHSLQSLARTQRRALSPDRLSPRLAAAAGGVPQPITLPFQPGGTVHFPAALCALGPLGGRCTTNLHGRSVHLHPDQRLLVGLREQQQTRARRGGRSCASAWRSRTPWRMGAPGKGGVLAAVASARSSSLCVGARWCTTCR